MLCLLVAGRLRLRALAGASPGPTPRGGTLRVSTWGNDSRLRLTQKAADAFMAANPDIKVSVENSEWGSYWEKLATTTAANDAPDVIQMDESYIAAYGSRDALLDLDTGEEQSRPVGDGCEGARHGQGGWHAGRRPDRHRELLGRRQPRGAPEGRSVHARRQDLDLGPPRRGSAAQVSEKLGSKACTAWTDSAAGAAELGAWTRQKGEEVWPTDGPGVSEATLTSFFDYANELIARKATPPASLQVENISAPLDASLFATNKAAFHMLFHTQVSAFGTASGTEMKLLRIPTQAAGESPKMVNKASMYWSVSARSEHPEASAKLIDFLLTDPAATKILTTERGIPAIPAVQQEVAPLLDPQAKIALEFSQTVAPELVPPPQVTPANASGFGSEFTTTATDVLFGKTSSADGAAKVLSIIEGMRSSRCPWSGRSGSIAPRSRAGDLLRPDRVST